MVKYLGLFWSFIVKGAGLFAGLALSMVLARTLGVADYGIYTFVMSVMAIALIPVQNGLPALIVRETASYSALKLKDRVNGIWRWADFLVLKMTFLIFVILGLLVLINHFYWGYEKIEVLGYVMPLLPIVALLSLRAAALRGLKKIVKGQFPETVIRPGCTALIVYCSYFYFDDDVSVTFAILAAIGSAFLALLISQLFLWRLEPGETEKMRDFSDRKIWISSLVPLSMVAGVQVLNGNLDVLMLGFLSSESEIGSYRVAVIGGSLIVFGVQVMSTFIAPYLSQYAAEKKYRMFVRLHYVSSAFMFGIALCVYIFALFWGEFFVEKFYGNEYLDAYGLVMIIGAGHLISAASGSVGLTLNMLREEKIVLRAVLYSLGANFLLGAILIPSYGSLGAAFSTAVALSFWNIYLSAVLYKKWKHLEAKYD